MECPLCGASKPINETCVKCGYRGKYIGRKPIEELENEPNKEVLS